MIRKYIKVGILIIMLCSCMQFTHINASDMLDFRGQGTKASPYLIENFQDLCLFRDLVNKGNEFENEFFSQTENIDMRGVAWDPVGIFDSGRYFYGVYDGNGHYVENLSISYNQELDINNNGFFGVLGGTVVNFGIESGHIQGDYVGAIASHSIGEKAAIINCYSKADVTGIRASGIADNFNGGIIVGCWSDGRYVGETTGGVLSYGGDVKVYGCYTTSGTIVPKDVRAPLSYTMDATSFYTEVTARKMNVTSGLIQYLFASQYDVNGMQWKLDKAENLVHSNLTSYIQVFGFINWYLLPLMLLLAIIYYLRRFYKTGKEKIWEVYQKQIKAFALVGGIVSFFLDTALYAKGLEYINWGNGSFIFLVNAVFVVALACVLKNRSKRAVKWSEVIPLFLLCSLVVILGISQFSVVPRYDGHLYYGSFVEAIDLFSLDLLTYIGAFICWKWMQGLALLLAPLEFLMPGQMIGVYIANILIILVTLCLLYWLLRRIFFELSPVLTTLCCAVFVFLPYGMGMLTYLCMDWHLPFFLVWLLAAYVCRNNVFIAFCGYLLAFTKITGLVFYVVFLLVVFFKELMEQREGNLWTRICKWWEWKKVIWWVFPAVLYIISYFYGSGMLIQNFSGAEGGAVIGLKSVTNICTTLMQSFVWGFRWLFLLGGVIALILLWRGRQRMKDIVSAEGMKLILGVGIGCAAVFLLLCMFDGNASCPRYTIMFNLFYVLILPIIMLTVFKNENASMIATGGLVVILVIQTYWTIDPSILYYRESIATGKKEVYRLASAGDNRSGMRLGKKFGEGIEVIGDLYVYNYEYTFYDDLLEQMLIAINPTEKDTFLILDIMGYELNLKGEQYKIYWNTRTQKRTYDGSDKDSIYLENSSSIITESLCNEPEGELMLPDKFHMIVVSRVDGTKAIERIKKEGYIVTETMKLQNRYGRMSVYTFEK